MKESKHIFIPYYHSSLELRCDFIFQTIRVLLARGYTVHLFLRQHQYWFFLPWSLITQRKNIQHSIYQAIDIAASKNLKLYCVPYLFPQWLVFLLQRFGGYNDRFSERWITKRITSYPHGVLWNFDLQNAQLYRNIPKKRFITLFDCVDYYTSVDPDREAELRLQEKIILRSATAVIVNSHVLFDLYRRKHDSVHLVPQGFDVATMKKQSLMSGKQDVRMFSLAEALRKPKIGFIGNLTYRIDFGLLTALVQKHPEYQFLLSDTYLPHTPEDNVYQTTKHIARLKECSNITWIPSQKREGIKKWIAICDICIVPYDTHQKINRYSYPMKVFEYFFAGKPVISTPLKELRRFSSYIALCSSVAQWEKHIVRLLASPWVQKSRRAQKLIARENSWEHKVDAILGAISLS